MERAEQSVYSPFDRSYIARLVKFPGGSRETLLRVVDRQRLSVADSVIRSKLPSMPLADPDSSELRAARYKRDAVARARRQLRWGVQCIRADRLLTCTFRENLTDRKRSLLIWNHFRTLVMARVPDWVFVAVIEHQVRGAIHFHVAVRGFQNVSLLRSCWLRAAGDAGGNIDVAYRGKRWGGVEQTANPAKIAGYMAKYIGKEFDTTPKGGKRFFGSEGRDKPVIDRWWIQARTDGEAFEVAYRATCGEKAVGVQQWISGDGSFYWISAPDPHVDADIPF